MGKPGQRELKIGACVLAGAGTAFGVLVGMEGILYALIICVLSIASYYLYTMPTRHSTFLWFIKVPANIIFNIHLLPLLVMSWTIRPYKRHIELHEERERLRQNNISSKAGN
jgi:hypothetical protein